MVDDDDEFVVYFNDGLWIPIGYRALEADEVVRKTDVYIFDGGFMPLYVYKDDGWLDVVGRPLSLRFLGSIARYDASLDDAWKDDDEN